LAQMNAFSHYCLTFGANDRIFCLNEQQKVYTYYIRLKINFVPSASVTLFQPNGRGKLWNNPKPESENLGSGLKNCACVKLWNSLVKVLKITEQNYVARGYLKLLFSVRNNKVTVM